MELVRLTVKGTDSQSEILVLDARGRMVKHGLGPTCEADLEPGIYRVKMITGSESQERTVFLTQPRSVEFSQTAFVSPIPLVGTSTSHEYHMAAAANESVRTHVGDGKGSSLFFLVRDWTPNATTTDRRITGNPAEGLSLHSVTGAGDRKICDLAAAGATNPQGDPWSACTIDVEPGVYELRLALPSGSMLYQSFVASPNWQTQAFVFMRGYRRPEPTAPLEWRADLSRTSVLLTWGKGFSPDEKILRVAELARQALAARSTSASSSSDRPLLPDDMRTLLRQKVENPMLGIYAAHLLLLEASPDIGLLSDVVRHLRAMLGAPHPDVEALALRAPGEPPPIQFAHPPMLRRSWSLIVDASVTSSALLTDALVAHCKDGNFWAEGPWHIRESDAAAAVAGAEELSDVELAVAEDLGLMREVRRAKFEEKPRADPAARRGGRHVPRQTQPQSSTAPQQPLVIELDTDRLRSLARKFGLPQTQLQSTLTALEGKFTRAPNIPDLKVILKG